MKFKMPSPARKNKKFPGVGRFFSGMGLRSRSQVGKLVMRLWARTRHLWGEVRKGWRPASMWLILFLERSILLTESGADCKSAGCKVRAL